MSSFIFRYQQPTTGKTINLRDHSSAMFVVKYFLRNKAVDDMFGVMVRKLSDQFMNATCVEIF
jgi:hypothetical protein